MRGRSTEGEPGVTPPWLTGTDLKDQSKWTNLELPVKAEIGEVATS